MKAKYFVKHFCLIPPPYGGVTVYVKRLALSLCKNGLPSGAFSNELRWIPASCQSLFRDPFPKHIHSLLSLLEVPKLLRCFAEYRLIHSHYGVNVATLLWIIHKIQKKPLVMTIHNQMIDREFGNASRLDRLCFKFLARDSQVQILAVNPLERQALEAMGIKYANRVAVVPPYVPPVEIGSPDDYLDKELVSFLDAPYPKMLFYAESFAEYKGRQIYGISIIVDLFVKLKQEIPGLRLVFCLVNGGADLGKIEELKTFVCQRGYEDSVYWQIGPVPEMWPLLKSCSVLVRPTCTDGDSVLVREALAYGLAVVASDVTVRPAGCAVYEYQNEADLYGKVKESFMNVDHKEVPQHDYTEEMIKIYKKLSGE